jgi:acetyl esterase/lipase
MMKAGLIAAVLAMIGFQGGPQAQTYVFKTAGECRLKADVYRAGKPGPRPAILWIHGGALIFGGRDNINRRQLAEYVEAGYTVVSIDYRLAPETKLPAILEDISDAWSWMRTTGPGEFGIDPDRIAVVGHSAGGYLTLTCGYRLRPAPRALVSFYGYGDIAGDWYSKPDPFYSREPAVPREKALAATGSKVDCEDSAYEKRWPFYLYCRQQGLWPREVAGIDPAAEPGKFDPFCPVLNVTGSFVPAILLHGDKDTDVPFQQSVDMDRALTKAGVDHEFVPIPGGAHGFDRQMDDPGIENAFRKVLSFLHRHLDGAGQGR